MSAPLICDYLSRKASFELYAEGTKFYIGRIDMESSTGTYPDSPFHRYEWAENALHPIFDGLRERCFCRGVRCIRFSAPPEAQRIASVEELLSLPFLMGYQSARVTLFSATSALRMKSRFFWSAFGRARDQP